MAPWNRKPSTKSQKLPPGASRLAVDALVDLEAIEDNLVRRKDGWYAAIIEVEGESFGLIAPDEQDLRIEAFGRVLNGLQDNRQIQITRLVEPTNLDQLAEYFHGVAERHGDNALGSLANAWGAAMDVAQHTLFSHVTLMTLWAKTADDCQEQANLLLASLRDHQFSATQCDNDRLGWVLQTTFGHSPLRMTETIGGWTHQIVEHQAALDDESKTRPVKTKTRRSEGLVSVHSQEPPVLAPHMPALSDLIEPAVVIEQPGLLDLGGVYASTLVARTWPEQVGNQWLEWLYNFDEAGVRRRVSFYIEPLPTSRVMADLRRRQVQLDAETHWSRKRGLREDFDVQLGEEAIDFLREEIGRGRQRMFLTTLFVTLLSDNPEKLRRAQTHLQQKAAGYSVALRSLYLEESLGFRATVPLGVQPLGKAPNRAVPTMVIGTTFPFSAGEVLDDVGDVWGENRSTGNLVVVDPNRFQARHMIAVAKTRSGKSATLKVLATQALMRPDEGVIIIDPSPPIDYERWTRWLGGTYAQFGPGSPDGINPMEILLPTSMDRLDDTMRAPIRSKIAFGSELFAIMGRQDLSPEEQTAVEEVLARVYTAFGMPPSTSPHDPSEWASVRDTDALSIVGKAKPSPTLTDVWNALMEDPATRHVGLRIKPFITGVFNMFAGKTTVDINKPLVVFNVYHLIQGSAGKQHQAVAYAMIAEYIRWRLAQARRRTFVIIDEGHVMFGREDTARFVSQLFRMAGKQGGRVALITQGIVDIVGDPSTGMQVPGQMDARFCIENSGFNFLMHTDNDADIALIEQTLGITPAEGRAIKSAQHGQGILMIGDPRTGTKRVHVHVYIPDALYPWITTVPEEVEAFRQQGVFAAVERPVAVPAGVREVGG